MDFASLLHITKMEGDEQESPLMGSNEDGIEMDAIRAGINIRKDGDFWNDFINLCGNAEAVSELLDVPVETVTGWAGKIRELVEKAEKEDGEEGAKSKRSEILATGDQVQPKSDFQNGTVSQDLNRPVPS